MEADVALDRAQADRLLLARIDLDEGLCASMIDQGRASDQVAVAGVVQALGQVDVLVPEEEALVEAVKRFPRLARDDEAGARGLADLGHLAGRRAGLGPLAEGAG